MTWMFKKIDRDLSGRTRIRHVLTVRSLYGGFRSWEDFIDENRDALFENGGAGEYILIPVGKIATQNRKYKVSGDFKKPIMRFNLG